MAKDLKLALSLADGAALTLPVAAAARRSLDDACAAGFADADFSCVARLLSGPRFRGSPAAPHVKQ